MPKVKHNPEKWARNAAQSSDEYLAGVMSPRRSQAASAIAAEDLYESALQDSFARNAYRKGLERSGDAKWQTGVKNKGRANYQTGVRVGKGNYDRGFGPYKSVIEGVTLAPRGPKGTNYGRSEQIGEALRKAKEAM